MDSGTVEYPAPPSPSVEAQEKKKRKKKKAAAQDEAVSNKVKKEKPSKFSGKSPKKKIEGDAYDREPYLSSSSSPEKHSRPKDSGRIVPVSISSDSTSGGNEQNKVESLMNENILLFEKSATLPSPSSPGGDSVFDDSPFISKREHSKSRSRSGSRSRFSGLFKRKKQRSRSETDVNRDSAAYSEEAPPERDRPRDPKRRAKSATRYVSDAQGATSAVGTPDSGTHPRKANLKRESPHYSYDSRIQPRDRLLNMTVRDAAKEHRLRRVDSGVLSPWKNLQGTGEQDSGSRQSFIHDTTTHFSNPGDVPTSLLRGSTDEDITGVGLQRTSALVHYDPLSSIESPERSSTLPRLALRSKSSSQAPFGTAARDKDYESSTFGKGRVLPRNLSSPAFPQKDNALSDSRDGTVLRSLSGDSTEVPAQNHGSLQKSNDAPHTRTGSRSSSPKGAKGADKRSSNEPEAVDGDSSREKQRKASLSKFLELRQALPGSLGLSRSMSQSSDSGVTSRDTSPSASIIQRHTRKNRGDDRKDSQKDSSVRSTSLAVEKRKSQPPFTRNDTSPPAPSQNPFFQQRSTNPYVVSSVSIPDSNVLSAPRLYLNGANLDSNDENVPQKRKEPVDARVTDDSSSLCPSSNMETSVSSSYRSSDQGFVGSESSDADADDTVDVHDDDNSDFSTPPEEVEPFSPTEEDAEASMRFATPNVLERLLEDTQKQISENNTDPRYLYSGSQPPGYVSQGIRRSNSDVDTSSRAKSPRRTFRQGPSFSDGTTGNVTLSESLETLRELPPATHGEADRTQARGNLHDKKTMDEDRLSAASTSTLTSVEPSVFLPFEASPSKTLDQSKLSKLHPDRLAGSDPRSNQDRLEQKVVPVMGTSAQQKYRRTFSPSRTRKVLVPTPEEDTTGPSYARSPSSALPPPPSPISCSTSEPISRPPTTIPVKHLTSTSMLATAPFSPSSSAMPMQREISNKNISQDAEKESKDGVKPASFIYPQSSPDADSYPTKCVPAVLSDKIPRTAIKESQALTARGVSLSSVEPINRSAPVRDATITSTGTPKVVTMDVMTTETVPSQEAVPKAEASEFSAQASLSQGRLGETTSALPLIHGLELSSEKSANFKGSSLADYLQEQVRMKWRGMEPSKKDKNRSSAKKKVAKKESKKLKNKQKKAEEKTQLLQKDLNEDLEQEASCMSGDEELPKIEISVTDDPNVSIVRKEPHREEVKIMIDKECQTSAWLINSLIRAKSSKTKKKTQSATKARKRRDSSASDTFIPGNLSRQRRNATQWSSLGDVRLVAAAEEQLRISRSPDKKLARSKSNRSTKSNRSKKSADENVAADSSKPGGSKQQDEEDDLPKPKKLSLTAIILLKNRLAKYKERKKREREIQEAQPEDEQIESDVPSDTMITIENELNLSKLEVSKETDIVDDDFFEPEFSLDYSKKQIRFEDISPNEPMQSEEPLPPLPPQTSRRMRQRRESTMRERRRKCVSYCKKFIAFLFSHIGLCSLVVAYTIMGGFIFQALESTKDLDFRKTIVEKRTDMIGHLIDLAVDFKDTESSMLNLTKDVSASILEYQEFIVQKVKDESWDGQEEGLWSFASSLLYAITVTTTIGYGHVAPKTSIGRLVTIGYAVVGIPLTLLCLTNIGDVMATGFRLLYGKVCCGICCTLFKPRRRRLAIPTDLEKGLGLARPVVTSNEDEAPDKSKEVVHVPTSLCLLLIAGYIIAGAMLFAAWEKWDMLKGSYFCFITLSTIGFGDIVPGMESDAWAQEEKLVLCALYLVLGLSLIAMCFNLVQEDVKAKCKWLGMKLGIVEKPKTPI